MFGFLILLFISPSRCNLKIQAPNITDVNKKIHITLHQMNAFLADVEKNIQVERRYLTNIGRHGSKGTTGYMEYDVTDIWWPTPPKILLHPTNFSLPAEYISVPYTTEIQPETEGVEFRRRLRSRLTELRRSATQHANPRTRLIMRYDNKDTSEAPDNRVSPGAQGQVVPEHPQPEYQQPPREYHQLPAELLNLEQSRPALEHVQQFPDAKLPQNQWQSGKQPRPGLSKNTRQGIAMPPHASEASTAPTGWTHELQSPTSSTTVSTTLMDLIWGPVPGVVTTTVNPFLQQLHEELERERAGYFTVFLIKLFELVAKKEQKHITALTRPIERIVTDWSERGLLVYMGTPLYGTFISLAGVLSSSDGDNLKTEATMFYSLMKNREVLLAPDVKAILNYVDLIFTDKQGQRLFYALEELDAYPGHHKTYLEVTQELLDSIMDVYKGIAGTSKRVRLHEMLNNALLARHLMPHQRRSAFSWANNPKNYDKPIRKLTHRKLRNSYHKKSYHVARSKNHQTRTRHKHKYKKKLDKIIKHQTHKHHSKPHREHRGLKPSGVRKKPSHSKSLTLHRWDAQNRRLYSPDVKISHTGVTRTGEPGTYTTPATSTPKGQKPGSEESRLRVHLNDALYHGNRSFVRVLGSGETDEEMILKSNIHKYFGYDPYSEIKDTSV